MAAHRVLVVEDDPAIRQGVVDALRFDGYETFEAGDGRAGLDMAVGVDCDLVLLDLILPHIDGLEILREVRLARPTLPVIILTARGEERDRVQGLRLGADDYVVKPFSVKELLARVHAVLRRSPERPLDIATMKIPGGQIDLQRREVRFDDGAATELTERESELIRYLALNPGRVITRQELMARVWRIDPDGGETRTVDMHIARLRDKLRDAAGIDDGANTNSGGGGVIVTVRGKGYMLAGKGATTS